MNLSYKKATVADIDVLVKSRIEVLISANSLPLGTDMSDIEKQSYDYYATALRDGTHIAYLVFDGHRLVGTGGVSFFRVMPTYHNPSGRKAYIMNMYTAPEYRRRGIAHRTLDMLIRDTHDNGITSISLEATAMGRPLYEIYGFVNADGEMELPYRQ